MDIEEIKKFMKAGQLYIDTVLQTEQSPGKFAQTPIEQSQIRKKDTIDYVPYIIDATLDQSTASDTDVAYVHNLGRVPRRMFAIAGPATHGDASGRTGMSFGFWQDSDVQTYEGSLINQDATNVKKTSLIFTTDDSGRGFKGDVVSVDEDRVYMNRTRTTVDDPARDARFLIAVFP